MRKRPARRTLRLLVFPEQGGELVRIAPAGVVVSPLTRRGDIADAARAPDGSIWLLLRSWTLGGIRQSLAPLLNTGQGYRPGPTIAVPGGPLDNFEGLAIERRPGGCWRFWLLSDDGHRMFARTLLVALDYDPGTDKESPAPGAGPSSSRSASNSH